MCVFDVWCALAKVWVQVWKSVLGCGGGEERRGEMCGVRGSLLKCGRGEGKGVWRYGDVRGGAGNVRGGAGSVRKCKERCGEICSGVGKYEDVGGV